MAIPDWLKPEPPPTTDEDAPYGDAVLEVALRLGVELEAFQLGSGAYPITQGRKEAVASAIAPVLERLREELDPQRPDAGSEAWKQLLDATAAAIAAQDD